MRRRIGGTLRTAIRDAQRQGITDKLFPVFITVVEKDVPPNYFDILLKKEVPKGDLVIALLSEVEINIVADQSFVETIELSGRIYYPVVGLSNQE